ncbi:MAG: 6-bladed beta-propeller [Chlorobi bacterium]|nr:6-bladed beta-propeller [Chlorobiota bacterium]
MKNVSIIILLLIFTLATESCKVFQLNRPQKEKTVIVFPSPPDTARIQFLTSVSSSADITGKQSKFSKFIIGEEKPRAIIKPFGVKIRFGKIYVCDIGTKGLEIIDLEKRTFNYFKPDGKGSLKIPVNCYIDEKGYLYIADSGRQQIVIFDNNGNYYDAFGMASNFKPIDVFVSDNKIYTANIANHKIDVFSNDKTHKLIASFPNVSPGDDGYLYQPKELYVTNDKVYVSDFGGFKINIFSATGKYLSSVGSQGTFPGQFAAPKGIAVDHDENLYVIDAAFGNVQIFNKNNKLLLYFGNPYKGKGYMYLPASIAISYEDIKYFEKYVDPEYNLKYLILVSNQYGPDKINVYGRIELKN